MKSCILMIAIALVTAACQPANQTTSGGGKPGDSRSFLPQTADGRDGDPVRDICGALDVKNREILDYVDREVLAATYQESSCGGKLGKVSGHDVKVRNVFGQLQFQNSTNNFGLPEVELTSSGTMKEICQKVSNLQNPMPAYPGSQSVIEFRAADTSHCRNDSQHACVIVYKGRMNADGRSYTVDETTLIGFRTVRGRTGFYTYKKVTSYGACSGGNFRTKIATFDI